MRFLKLYTVFFIVLFTTHCKTKTATDNKHDYSIEIQHFAGAAGLTIYYTVNGKYVQVESDCDFENCERKLVYKRELSVEQSDALFKELQSLRLDTLKKSYRPDGMVFDGLVSSIKIRGRDFPNKEISIDNVDLPTTNSLYKIIDKLILPKKYQFYHYGEK